MSKATLSVRNFLNIVLFNWRTRHDIKECLLCKGVRRECETDERNMFLNFYSMLEAITFSCSEVWNYFENFKYATEDKFIN